MSKRLVLCLKLDSVKPKMFYLIGSSMNTYAVNTDLVIING